MIESFTITNHLGESLVLELTNPEESGLVITSVTGLGQVDADVNTTKLAGSDYSIKNSAFLIERNVVFSIKYYGDDIEVSRGTADRIFPTSKAVTIDVKTDYKELTFSGTVEKNEPAIFNKSSGCQVSIKCTDPFMYEKDALSIPFGGIEPMFEFPFHSDIEGFGDDMIEFGNIRIIKEKSIYYTGEAEVGFTINIHSTGIVRGFTIYNLDQRKRIDIDDDILTTITGSGIIQGDDIVISTIKGHKSATLTRNGITYNILNALAKNKVIDWFELQRGDNLMAYSAEEGEYDMMINIKYRISHKGV